MPSSSTAWRAEKTDGERGERARELVGFLLSYFFFFLLRGIDLEKEISAQPNSQSHISVLSPEMNRPQ